MGTNYTALALSGAILGWQSPRNDRGTWDIIWSSVQTLTLCAWVSVCTSAASPDADNWDVMRDKFYFVLLTLLGPEFVLMLAFGQWHIARASAREYHDAGYKHWTIVHSFYADMGGIHVKSSDFPSFPVDARQLLYLLKKNFIDLPDISREDIRGLGKADNLAKVITLFQATSFLVNAAARLAQGLAVTTLEMTVLANIFCTLITYLCWWNKPTDVEIHHFCELKTTMHAVITDAGQRPNAEYRDTPLDFVSRREWAATLLWNYWVNILHRITPLRRLKCQQPPVQKFTSFNWPLPGTRPSLCFLMFLALVYSSFFIAAWDFYFPSGVERHLWGAAVTTQAGFIAVGPISVVVTLYKPVNHEKPGDDAERSDSADTTSSAASRGLRKARDLWNMPCNNELTGNFPSLDVPFRSLFMMSPVCALYVICRWFILAEDIASLRSLPASAYETVDWSKFLPWI